MHVRAPFYRMRSSLIQENNLVNPENITAMKTTMFISSLSLFLLTMGCHSAERLVDEGRYDELLSLAERKMTGDKVKKEKHILMAEEAFAKITQRDMDRIDRLKQSNRSEDWKEIASIAERIGRRQEKLQPFLPLISENGYQAKFSFVKTQDILLHAENQIVETLYDEALGLLLNARSGDKSSAQKAYYKFDDVLRYRNAYRDASGFRDESRQLGITHVLLTVENRVRAYMPGYVASVLEESVQARNGFWTQYYTEADKTGMDYHATFVVNAIEVGPAALREERIKRQKKIEDGWQYVLDANGNVAKDTSGNDIKKVYYAEVHAVVLKTYQEKGVVLRGFIEIRNTRDGNILETRPVLVESRFRHEAQSFFGDERALEKSDRQVVGLLPFPSDEAMMLEVVQLAQPVFTNELGKSRYL